MELDFAALMSDECAGVPGITGRYPRKASERSSRAVHVERVSI